jgi:hypothetical protein
LTNKAKQYLSEAKKLIASGEAALKKSDADKWGAAERLYLANVEEGVNQREAGAAVGLTQKTVSYYVKLWKLNGVDTARYQTVSFTEAYMEMRGAGSQRSDIDERAAKAVLSDPARAAKVLDSLDTDAKANVVKHVAKSDKGAMTDAMQDPKARMRAEGASSRARDIARTEAKNERKAAGGGTTTPDQGAAALFAIGNIMSDGAAWAGRLSDAWEQLLRVGTDDQVEAAKGRIATGAFPITKVIGDITGTGVDAALAQMLGDTEV